MKSLKLKWVLLSSVLFLSSFDVWAEDVAKNPAETKYQSLLSAGNYDDLSGFLGQMVDRMKKQLAAAKKAETELKDDEFADEMEVKTAHDDTVNKQFALKFWSDRLDAVGSLRAATEEDKKQIEQINKVLPKVIELVKSAIEKSHEGNAAYADLANYVKENAAFLKTIDGVKDSIPEITFEKAVKQVIQDNKVSKFQKAIEGYLAEFEQNAKNNEASGKQKAAAVERSSNSKLAKGPGGSKGAAKRKAAAAKEMDDSSSAGASASSGD